jgi:hypothetical protein
MTVLCLVEQGGDGAADASLRALTFSRELAAAGQAAGAGPAAVAAVVFGGLAGPMRDALAAAGVTAAYAVESDRLAS